VAEKASRDLPNKIKIFCLGKRKKAAKLMLRILAFCFCYLFYFISYLFYQGGVTTVICSVPTTPITASTTTTPKTTPTPSKNSFNLH
jgi:hypothetical protein